MRRARLNLHALLGRMGEEVRAKQTEFGEAGGTVALWVATHDGLVFGLTEVDGPFQPDENDVVDVTALALSLYPSVEDYLDGAPPEMTFVIPPSAKMLARTVRWVVGS